VVKGPHVGAGKTWCWCDLAAQNGSVAWTVTPANAWGAPAASSGTVNMIDFAAPAPLGAATVVPVLP
jgi:hypothetical protein